MDEQHARVSEAPHPTTILIVEDELNIIRLLRLYLEGVGFQTLVAHDGATGLALWERSQPDLIVLDLMLPNLDGWEVTRRIRRVAQTPILMLTARRTEDDRILGLDLGADDYVTKPFSPREIVSRINAILRRVAPTSADTPTDRQRQDPATERLTFDGLVIVPAAHRVEVDGASIDLTAKEFDVLLTLARAPDQALSRETLLSRVWGFDYLGDSRTVDVHIGTLRKKIERDPARPRFIKTIWRVGYRFDPTGVVSPAGPLDTPQSGAASA